MYALDELLYKSKEFFAERVDADRNSDLQGNGRVVWRVVWNVAAVHTYVADAQGAAVVNTTALWDTTSVWVWFSSQAEESQKLKYQIVLQKVIEKFG